MQVVLGIIILRISQSPNAEDQSFYQAAPGIHILPPTAMATSALTQS